jgi:hypothetical protein
MSGTGSDQLYQLLPAIYRLRDAERGEPLRALLAALAAQAGLVEADIARLYKNWFIETCDEWLVPYIGDLLGVRGLLPPERAGRSQRALVSNTLRYRRRKGTVPLLEQLAHDVAGWSARAVELLNRVAVIPHLDHPRPGLGVAANLRTLHDMALVGSAFDPLAYTPDVRLMSGTRRAPELDAERPVSRLGRLAGVGQARPNLPNLGLFIWRLKTYRVERATAFAQGGGRFSFNPLGLNIPLFNDPPTRDFTRVAREHELPVALRAAALAAELEERRQAREKDREPATAFFGEQPAFEIFAPGSDTPIDPMQIFVCNLTAPDKGWIDPPKETGCRVALDPQYGRIAFPGDVPDGGVNVSYSYGFSDDIGGGPYSRSCIRPGGADTLRNPGVLGTLVIVGHENKQQPYACKPIYIAPDDPRALAKAVEQASSHAQALIQIDDNSSYRLPALTHQPALAIDLKGRQLVIQAAQGRRPVLLEDLVIKGSSPTSELTLSGLLIVGAISVKGQIGLIRLIDCTIIPKIRQRSGSTAAAVEPLAVSVSSGSRLDWLIIERSIVKALRGPGELGQLTISDSIIHATSRDPYAIRVANQQGTPFSATLARSTVFGGVALPELALAEDVLFTAPLTVERAGAGVLHNCYVPSESTELRQEHCLTDQEGRLRPAFTAVSYGEPGYAQLNLACPAELRTGGTRGAEIGVFHNLRQPQREAALLAQLEEYLRFGLEVGLIYVT